jgi:hypothetical protein
VNKAVNSKEAVAAAMVVVNKVAAAMAAVVLVDKEMAEIWEEVAVMVDNKDIENFLCFYLSTFHFLFPISLYLFELNIKNCFFDL